MEVDSAVEISFDCLPLRSVGRLDAPLDASPQYHDLCLRMKQALEKHGAHNCYYLRQGRCAFHLTNDPKVGVVALRFEGVVLTDETDTRTRQVDVDAALEAESCEWLTRPVSDWFSQIVKYAVAVEFDRYIAAGDLQQAIERMDRIQAQCAAQQGYLGMYL